MTLGNIVGPRFVDRGGRDGRRGLLGLVAADPAENRRAFLDE